MGAAASSKICPHWGFSFSTAHNTDCAILVLNISAFINSAIIQSYSIPKTVTHNIFFVIIIIIKAFTMLVKHVITIHL